MASVTWRRGGPPKLPPLPWHDANNGALSNRAGRAEQTQRKNNKPSTAPSAASSATFR
jgi:hypothetical protein